MGTPDLRTPGSSAGIVFFHLFTDGHRARTVCNDRYRRYFWLLSGDCVRDPLLSAARMVKCHLGRHGARGGAIVEVFGAALGPAVCTLFSNVDLASPETDRADSFVFPRHCLGLAGACLGCLCDSCSELSPGASDSGYTHESGLVPVPFAGGRGCCIVEL